MPTLDAVIAGGGIGGAVLATLLARRGKRVLVVEKNAGPPSLVRPEGLWPHTVQLLSSILNVALDDPSLWVPVKGILLTQERETLLNFGADVFENAGAPLRMTDPNQTRERLLQSGAFELQRGVEVLGALKENGRIAGVRVKDAATNTERDIPAVLTVGDDGVHSQIRAACGIELKTQMFPVDFLCFGFDWPPNFPADLVHVFLNKQRRRAGFAALGAIRLPGGKGAGLVPAEPRVFDNTAKSAKAWQQFIKGDPLLESAFSHLKFPEGLARVRRPWGHAGRYGTEGAVLLGDAIHPVSPAGGQGANMSVADAIALADVLLASSPDFLQAYERRRRAANERSLDITRQAARIFKLPSFLTQPLAPFALRWLNRHPATFGKFLRSASTRFQDAPTS